MRGPQRALTILLLGLAAAHLAFARFQPAPTAFGDETHYLKVVQRDLGDGSLSLLPGQQRSAMRPELAGRFFANLAGASAQDGTALIRRVTPWHILLHLATVALVFLQARLLGVSGRGSVAAAAALGLFPWYAFHVQALWPETLHAFLAAVCLTALLAYQRHPRVLLLVPAGLALGYALLAKSSLSAFALVSVPFIAAWTWRMWHGDTGRERALRSLVAAVLFAGSIALVVVPQMNANRAAGFGHGLGANRWWNLELALRTPARVPAAEGDSYGLARWELQRGITDAYMAASKNPLQREQAARARSLAHLRDQGYLAVAREQLAEFADVLIARPGLSFYRAPCLEQALGYRARWGEPAPGWIRALAWPARPMWWALLALGAFGLALGCRREPRFWLPVAFLLCGLAVVLVVPLKFRFLVPLVPVLCLGFGRTLDALPGERAVASGAKASSPA